MTRYWTLVAVTLGMVAFMVTPVRAQQTTFLVQPDRAMRNVTASPKFDERVFVFRSDPVSSEILDHNAGAKEIVLGIGAKDGVRFGHAFNICKPDSKECVGVAKVMELEGRRCIAKVVSIDADKSTQSMKGFIANCASPKPNARAIVIDIGYGKHVWQTESWENKIIQGLLEAGGDQVQFLIRQEDDKRD